MKVPGSDGRRSGPEVLTVIHSEPRRNSTTNLYRFPRRRPTLDRVADHLHQLELILVAGNHVAEAVALSRIVGELQVLR